MLNSSDHIRRCCICSWIIITLFLSGCGLNIVRSDIEQTVMEATYPEQLTNLEWEQVKLSVEIPAPLADGEKLYVDLLDEVTGSNFNANRLELFPLDERNYQTDIPVIRNSDVKYRYVRIGSNEQTEVTAFGIPVRYRMMRVSPGMEIDDVIAAWPDLPYQGPIGKMSGVVYDVQNHQALTDILVTVAGYQTFTDMSGKFVIDGLPTGIHTTVAYAIDGSYQTYQQGVNIMENLSTPAEIKMIPLPEVNVTFIVTPPNDAIGAPIRFSGNYYQFGNTFADLTGGFSTLASRMPLLIKMDDGRYSISLKLHAGNFLEYKYTLGDGYTNAERKASGEFNLRQLIIPGEDITIEDQIETWRVDGIDPIPIQVTIPSNTPPIDSISIQLYDDFWLQPIPMWPMGNNQWLYLLFSPPEHSSGQLVYRFCRNDQCETAHDLDSELNPHYLNPTGDGGNNVVFDQWSNWEIYEDPEIVLDEAIPERGKNFLTGIELLSQYHPSYQNRYELVFNELAQYDANWMILTPTWMVNDFMTSPHIEPVAGSSPLVHDLIEMIEFAHKAGMQVALFPQLDFGEDSTAWWHDTSKDALWWQEWFIEYERFLNNYAQLANEMNVEKLIIGGSFVNYSLPGGIPTTETIVGTPSNADSLWRTILSEIDATYDGSLLWALPFAEEDPMIPDFLDQVDAIYLLFDRNITDSSFLGDPYGYHITAGNIIDTEVFEIKTKFNKPIYIGLAYPSASGAGQSCVLDRNGSCKDSLLISPLDQNVNSEIGLQEQFDIYNALCKVIVDRDWIEGFVSRGFFPPVKLTDFSSSIFGKPAMDVVWYWYSSVK